jgi:predicted esterase
MVPFMKKEMPDLARKRIFIASGSHDVIVDPQGTRRLHDLLVDAGAAVELHRHEGGHELGQDDLLAAREWLSRWEQERRN